MTDTIPSNTNIFASSVDPSLSCVVLKGRLTLYVDDTLIADPSSLESLYSLTRFLIKGGMSNGELALLANDAVVELRYIDDVEKMLAPIAAVVAPPQGNNNKVLWSLVALAALLALLALLALARLFKRKKRKDEEKAFGALEDDKDIATVKAYDLDGFSDFSSARVSDGSSIRPWDQKKHVTPRSDQEKNIRPPPPPPPVWNPPPLNPAPSTTHLRTLTPLDIEGLEDFLDDRFASDEELVPVGDSHENNMYARNAQDSRSDWGVRGQNEQVSLRHVELRRAELPVARDEDEQDYTYEAMGTNRGFTPKCSICYKDADGWMRSCQCGNASCDKIAHAICIDSRYPTPSVSYPGTPPPSLPVVLCRAENMPWLNRSRSRNSDEDNSVVSSLSKSRSFDESVNEILLAGGFMSCLH